VTDTRSGSGPGPMAGEERREVDCLEALRSIASGRSFSLRRSFSTCTGGIFGSYSYLNHNPEQPSHSLLRPKSIPNFNRRLEDVSSCWRRLRFLVSFLRNYVFLVSLSASTPTYFHPPSLYVRTDCRQSPCNLSIVL
jgi:hypothetical protein